MEKMTSLERLYQPDYGCIFGQQHANAFLFGEIDSLIWPVFQDIKSSNQLRNLLTQIEIELFITGISNSKI